MTAQVSDDDVRIISEFDARPGDFFPLAEAHKYIPHSSYKTIRAWAYTGCKPQPYVRESGFRVYLEVYKNGNCVMTSMAAYKRFRDKLNGATR